MENQVIVQEKKDIINVKADSTKTYCSVKAGTDEEKIALFNAINGDAEGKRIADMINMEIEVKDVYFEHVELVDEDTGEVQIAPRAVLIAPDGTTYNSTSFGILSSIERCILMFGEPTWEPAKKFMIKQPKTKNGSMLKLEMVAPKAKK